MSEENAGGRRRLEGLIAIGPAGAVDDRLAALGAELGLAVVSVGTDPPPDAAAISAALDELGASEPLRVVAVAADATCLVGAAAAGTHTLVVPSGRPSGDHDSGHSSDSAGDLGALREFVTEMTAADRGA